MRTGLIQQLLIYGFFIILLSGCYARPMQTTPPARIGLKLAPATLGATISLQQHLIVERGGRTDELDTALEIDPQQLNLVGLAFGQRIISLQFDGKTLQTWRHLGLPPQINGENVLEDIELTLWPVAAIRQALPAGWSIIENGQRRTVLLNNIPVVEINYVNGRRWGGTVVLTNLRYHYRLTIQSVSTP